MKNSNENKYRNKLRASRTVNIVLSVLLILSVCIAPIFAAASNRFDVTGDGLVDTRDIVRMMKYIAGAIDEDGNPITPGDNDDSGDKPSVTPAYNTVSVNGVPVYSYSGSMWLYDENGSSGRDEETNKLIKDDSNKGKVYRVTVSKKLIDSSADGTVKDPIEPMIFDYNDSYSFSWKDKNQKSIGSQGSSIGWKDSDGVIHYLDGILKYLRDYSIGDIVPVSMWGEVRYNSSTTSMDKYNGTYDGHEGWVHFDAIIEFEITE
mgnify:FL=1